MTPFDYRAFEELRRDTDEVMQLRRRASELLSARRASSFDGLGDLLRRILPEDEERRLRVAQVLRFSVGQLEGLSYSELDPVGLPPHPLVILGQVLGLDWDAFFELVALDHSRFSDASAASDSQGTGHERGAIMGTAAIANLQGEWERVQLDVPDDA